MVFEKKIMHDEGVESSISFGSNATRPTEKAEEMKPSGSEDGQPSHHPELTWVEVQVQARRIVSELTKLTGNLESWARDEIGMFKNLQKMATDTANAKNQECSIKKCNIFQAFKLVSMQINCIRNWNQLVETWNHDKMGFYSRMALKTSKITCTALQRVHSRKMEQLRATILSRRAVFVLEMHNIITLGLEMMAFVGVEALAASLLQKAIVGIVAFNDLLAIIRNDEEERTKIGFAMPDAISIQKILSILAERRAAKMADVLADILNDTMQSAERSPWSSANDEQPFAASTSDDRRNFNIVTSDYGSDQHAACSTDNRLSASQQTVDGLTALRTLQSQEELNIAKLVSVIHLTFMDVRDGGSGEASQYGQQRLHQWWTVNNDHDHDQTESGSCSKHEAAAAPTSTASNLSKYYEKNLQAEVVDMLTHHTRLRDVSLLPPSYIVDVGDCALKLCQALEDKLPMTKAYRQLQVNAYIEAVYKSWDNGMCHSLVAAMDSKCLAAVPIDDGQGTRAGRCLAKTLEPLIRLELATVHNKELDAGVVHDAVIPRLSASLRLTESWLRTRINAALTSWQLSTFCLITQGDLKTINDLLKHTVNVHPAQSQIRDSGCENSIVDHEAVLRRVTAWDGISETIAKIQNYSSTSMKQFCNACSERAHAALQQNMPRGKHWRQKCRKKGLPKAGSPYARLLVDEILGPVVDGVCRLSVAAQISVLTTATKVLCEAWMDHILTHQIRFSLHGAHLLKLDFNHVTDFLGSQPTLSYEARQRALTLEAIRRLRGAAALLLQQNETNIFVTFRRRRVAPLTPHDPESIVVVDAGEVQSSQGLDRLESVESNVQRDEDYVQNKDQWLQLRVHRSTSRDRQSPFWCFS